MPILNNGGKYIQNKGKRGTIPQAMEVESLQLKILFFYLNFLMGLFMKSFKVYCEKLIR